MTAVFNFAPFIGGSAILAACARHRHPAAGAWAGSRAPRSARCFAARSTRCGARVWSACSSLASPTCSTIRAWRPRWRRASRASGTAFIIVAPILGFIGVALSGSNTSTNAMFGKFQALVGVQLGMPPLLLPTLNSVGRGDRQADCAADRERGRFDQPLRAQGRRRHPPQHGLDLHPARLPDRHCRRLLPAAARRDAGAELGRFRFSAVAAAAAAARRPAYCAARRRTVPSGTLPGAGPGHRSRPAPARGHRRRRSR